MTNNRCVVSDIYGNSCDDECFITNKTNDKCTYTCDIKTSKYCGRVIHDKLYCLTHYNFMLNNSLAEAKIVLESMGFRYGRLQIACNIKFETCTHQKLITSAKINYMPIITYAKKIYNHITKIKFSRETRKWSNESTDFILNRQELKDMLSNCRASMKVRATVNWDDKYPQLEQEVTRIEMPLGAINKLYNIEEVFSYVKNINKIINMHDIGNAYDVILDWLAHGPQWSENIIDDVVTLATILKSEHKEVEEKAKQLQENKKK